MSNETTFTEDTADPDLLDGHLWRMAEKVADRAKAKGLAGRVVGGVKRLRDLLLSPIPSLPLQYSEEARASERAQ